MKNVTSKIPKTTGGRVADLRKAAGEKQEDLAAALGITRSQIAMVETDKRGLIADLIISIATRYDVSADYILCLSDMKMGSADDRAIEKAVGLNEHTIDILKYHASFNETTVDEVSRVFNENKEDYFEYLTNCQLDIGDDLQARLEKYSDQDKLNYIGEYLTDCQLNIDDDLQAILEAKRFRQSNNLSTAINFLLNDDNIDILYSLMDYAVLSISSFKGEKRSGAIKILLRDLCTGYYGRVMSTLIKELTCAGEITELENLLFEAKEIFTFRMGKQLIKLADDYAEYVKGLQDEK